MVIVGDQNVGKTSLIRRFVDEEFKFQEKATLAIDFQSKIIEVNKKLIKLSLWDTVGSERFNSICQSYYKGVSGVIIVFDYSDETTFKNL